MTISVTPPIIEEDRESNPKAVFLGELPEFANTIIEYLNERKVELFSAKTWDDIFFGDYFIYIGPLDPVKTFIEKNTKTLPQTLLLLIDSSATTKCTTLLAQNPKLKICLLDRDSHFTKSQTNELFAFFLTGQKQLLDLRKTSASSTQNTHVSQKEIITKNEPEDISIPAEMTLNLSSKHTQHLTSKTSNTNQPSTPTKKVKFQKSWGKKPIILTLSMLVLFLFLVLPLFSTFVFGALGVYKLQRADQQLQLGNIEAVNRRLQTADFSFVIAIRSWSLFFPLFSLSHLSNFYQGTDKLLEIGLHTTRAYQNLTQGATSIDLLIKTVLGKSTNLPITTTLTQAKNYLALADGELAQAQAAYKSAAAQNIFQKLSFFEAENFKTRLIDSRQQIQLVQNLISIAPELLGIYDKRTFLLALQNNMEIRPTGGFIGSYGLLTFDTGLLKNVEVNDIYTADGQLLGHVDPPEPIRVYLEQEHWYMRDSNWDPDFAESSKKLLWFLEKETGVIADGVIAVDLRLAKNLLEFMGPVELPGLQITVNRDNLFEVLHSQIESDFFPGSTKKADYLGALFRQILEKLPNAQIKPSSLLINAVIDALKQKSIQFYFSNEKIQEIVSQNNWLNKIPPADFCFEDHCVSDYLGVIDANMGVNKANAYVERQIQTNIKLLEAGKLIQTITINYQNSSTTDNKTQGDYDNYLRLYLPSDYDITEVKINDLPLSLEREILSASESTVRVYVERNSRVADVFLTVPKTAKRTVTVIATRQLDHSADMRYVFYLIKQPGYKEEKAEIHFEFSPVFTVFQNTSLEQADAVTLATGNQITYNTTLTQDEIFGFKLIKN